jgi:hypothetical protein
MIKPLFPIRVELVLRKVERGFLSFKKDICTRLDGLEGLLQARLSIPANPMAQTSGCCTPSGSHTELHTPVLATISTVPISSYIAPHVAACFRH